MSSFDAPKRGTISYVLDVPVGRGKLLGGKMSKGLDEAIGGWGINGTATFQTGFPLILTAQPTTLSSTFGGGPPRPNYIAGCAKSFGGSAYSRVKSYINAACFSQPGPFAFGNEPRTDGGIRAQGIANFDAALTKNFTLTERFHLKFDSEFFNLFNRVQFAAPTAQIGNPAFGTITATRNQQRLIQLALRLSF